VDQENENFMQAAMNIDPNIINSVMPVDPADDYVDLDDY
jgi:hypothetical protein